MRTKTIAVIGATGQQGGAVVDALLERGTVAVRALVRDPLSEKAKALASRGVELVTGDLTESATIDAVLEGADAAFAMTTPSFTEGAGIEIVTGKAIADAAQRTGLPHLVYSSVGGAERSTGIEHFESKRRVEEYIESLGLHATFVRPVYFMENLLAMGVSVEDGTVVVRQPLPDGIPLQMVSVRDIGRVAASILLDGTAFEGKSIEIAGDELTGTQIAAAFGAAAGLASRYEALPLAAVAEMGDTAVMFDWFAKLPAYRADFAGTRELSPGTLDLAQWIKAVGWSVA
ncbi:NmrA/HSCARG family protein [Tsukamurella spumae]|uniref:NmrA/HSCARG family protein n=1 Tax=Tsukamurella spumae TaxID=44753 RepID=A0A846X648_9ACTN|nr:NmrA/HSCARG family protein [Tsukamurella spumae]NKY20065.1 NmrA/HSCARG family protein [Tsukamurella spumae]